MKNKDGNKNIHGYWRRAGKSSSEKGESNNYVEKSQYESHDIAY